MGTFTLTQDSVSTLPARRVFDGGFLEEYCTLLHWIRSVSDLAGVKLRSIGVTACAPGAGTSTVALNLGMAAAQISDQPVLLLDLTNTRSPIPTHFNASEDLYLRGALAGMLRPGERVNASPIANLSQLAASQLSAFQASSVDYDRVSDLLQALEHDFGLIVVDLPTIESSLCFVAAGSVSGVLLVMEAERTHAESAVRAKQRLIDARANIFGVILNKHRQHIPGWLNAKL